MTSRLQHKGLQARDDRPQAPLTGLRACRVDRKIASQRDYFGGHGPAYGATAALPRQIITRSILSSGLSEYERRL